jgi:3-isopropylmalate dehydrogenase
MFLSAAMMLDWLAQRHGAAELASRARTIELAVERTLSTKAAVPMEYGGGAGTADFTKAVIAALPAAMREAGAAG